MTEHFLPTMTGTPPEGWAPGYVTIHIERPEETRIPVEAWRRGAFAIHGREYWADDGEKMESEAVLTHAPTGLRIYSFSDPAMAAKLAEAIAPLTDWDSIPTKMGRGSDLYFKVREVIDALEEAP